MAVLGRVLISSAERLDLPDLLSIDSYVGGDFKYLIKSLVGDTKPYILFGFDVINPSSAIGTPSLSINVSDSVVYYPGSNAGSFFFGLPSGNPLSQPLVPELRTNATNYVYLTLSTAQEAQDNRAFWDADKNSGQGGEFNQEINTENVLVAVINTSTSTFPENTIPICKVTVGPSVITSIEDCRDLMFRLGTGGVSPEPFSTYNFRNLPSAPFARSEPPITMVSAADPNPFEGGDKNIRTLKEWMDVVMTKLKELSGTTFWYQQTIPSASVTSIFEDVLGSTLKSKGQWQHSASTPGQVTWSEDITNRSLLDPRDIIFRANTVTLTNEQIAYFNLVRDQDLNPALTPVNWVTGVNYVNGAVGSFSNLAQGDWVKKKSDTLNQYLRVEQFYAGPNLTGGVTTAAVAQSIKLSGNYGGSTQATEGEYSKGNYQTSDVIIGNRTDLALQAAGGNFFWVVNRSDVIQNIGSIVRTTLTGSITGGDGVRAKYAVAAHGLVDGDRITIVGSASHNGTYVVEIEDANTLYINTASLTDEASVTSYYAVVTTIARSTADGYQLESANTGFEANETIHIAGTSTAFDGVYTINVRSATSFQVPYGAATSSIGAVGTATSVRVDVRKSFGAIRIEQGESIDIGEIDGKNIQSYIGMTSLSQTKPIYLVPGGYNALAGFESFNADPLDDLTVRASKLSAMMADRVQDRSLKIIGSVNLKNVTSGLNQNIISTGYLIVEKPGTPQQTITFAGTNAIPANSAIVAVIDRNGSGTITTAVESLGSPYLVAENKLILLYRFAGNTVYAWDGNAIAVNGSYTISNAETSQNRNIRVFGVSSAIFNLSTSTITFPSGASVTFHIPGSANNNHVDVTAINTAGGIVIPDLHVAWVRIDRTASKTFNVLQTSDVPDTDANGAIYVTAESAVPVDQDVFILYTRAGNDILMPPELASPLGHIYEETITVVASGASDSYHIDGPVPASTIIPLPLDTRSASSQRFYVVGAGMLQLFLNGQYLLDGDDWTEVGSPGSLSFEIEINRTLVVEDVLLFRDNSSTGVYFTPAPSPVVTLQQAYNAGRFIAVNAGQPISISGTGKLIEILGDMTVTGVIDPKGITFDLQASTPLTGIQYGLWSVTGSGDLMYARGGSSTINLVSDFVRRDGTSPATANIDLGGFKIINLADPTGAQDAATKNYVTNAIAAINLDATYLRLDGGNSPSANISWNSHKITNLANPTVSTDAANKSYVDSSIAAINLDGTYLRLDGTNTMSGNLNAGGHKVINLAVPTASGDAATKGYVDDPLRYSAVYITATNGSGSTVSQGAVVMFSQSTSGDFILASASALTTSEATIGVVFSSSIANGASGLIQVGGVASVVNQGAAFALGKRVYLDTTPGQATSVALTATGTIVFVIGYALTPTAILLAPYLANINTNIYEEPVTIGAPVISGTTLTLPVDSRNSSNVKSYVVASAQLKVILNGQELLVGSDYTEVGVSGSQSNQIQIQRALVVSDVIVYRVELSANTFFQLTGGGGGATLQTAYNSGSTITIAVGVPVTIGGPTGVQLVVNSHAQINGVLY